MVVFYWFFAILMGVSIGVGVSFLIFSALLNKSNNKGDSRLKNEDFSSQVVYLSQENNMGKNDMLFTNFVEANIEVLTSARDYQNRCATAITAPADALVERYIPNEADEAIADADTLGASDGNVEDAGVAGAAGVAGVTGVAGANAGSAATDKKPIVAGSIGVFASTNATSLQNARYRVGGTRSMSFAEKMAVLNNTRHMDPNAFSKPKESSWAAARRRNMGSDASENPWGRDEEWGGKPGADQKMDEAVMDLGQTKEKPKMTQEEIDAFWSGGSKSKTSTGSSSASSTSPAMDMPDPTISASPAASAPAPQEPIYEAPTATRPLWENKGGNDDFSDFEDFM